MKITSLYLPELPMYGLKETKADRLGRTVVLAGRNGAGKSRILQRVSAWNEPMVEPPRYIVTRHLIIRNRRKNAKLEEALARTPKPDWWLDDELWQMYLQGLNKPEQRAYQELEKSLREGMYELTFDDTSKKPSIVHFTPKELKLESAWGLGPPALETLARGVGSVGLDNLPNGALAYIQHLQTLHREATHAEFSGSAEERQTAVALYEGLNDVIHKLLGVPLGRATNGATTLYGQPIGEAKLSDGQRVLLQMAVALHAQAGSLADLILLMDEPENHLHPAAMLEVVERIEKVLTNGQLWLATHSVPLLARYNPDAIWWVNDGTMKHSGSEPRQVLESLLGTDERIYQLGDFLGLPAALAANHFASQCLMPPEVVMTGGADPQTQQIGRVLKDLAKQRGAATLKLLDYGAGRGRLAAALAENRDARSLVEYWAYDRSAEHRQECEASIEALHGSGKGKERCLVGPRALRDKMPPESVDIVIMCNVLHEIEPRYWLSIWGKGETVQLALKEDGYLLIVEDTEMRVGELAHAGGFLVLEESALRVLFSITAEDADFTVDAVRERRLVASLVPARALTRASGATLKAALQRVKISSMEEIRALRAKAEKEAHTYGEGRKHAFHVQQLANATLALKEMG